MSFVTGAKPSGLEPHAVCPEHQRAVALIIEGRSKDLGGFAVRRVLPSVKRRRVGPFIFFDHLGPAEFAPGTGVDVRPHPHINLATVTYIFEGELDHRDSLGSMETIRPGAINWMTAGRGIVHSERTGPTARAAGHRLHALQLWVGLPQSAEEVAPSFQHHPADTLPRLSFPGARATLLAGEAYGQRAPVQVHSPLFYVDAVLDAGARLPVTLEHAERAVYIVHGEVHLEGPGAPREALAPLTLVIFEEGADVTLVAPGPAHVVLLGGAPLDGERHMFWNFVSSSPERLEQAKRDWKEGRFPLVPGDEVEFIPLPE